jgi:hypothetical protein
MPVCETVDSATAGSKRLAAFTAFHDALGNRVDYQQ